MLPKFKKKQKNSTKTSKTASEKTAGFRMFTSSRHDQAAINMQRKAILGGMLSTLAAFVFLFIAGQFATQDFMMVLGGMVFLCGLLAYDIMGRRIWENRLSATIEKISTNHDRLVREVARNRSDIAILKEGLGEMGNAVKANNDNSVEQGMLQTIVNRLTALGEKPRPKIGTKHDTSVLELEMAPPPSRTVPANDIDMAMNMGHEKYSDTVVGELVQHAVREDKINIFMQPVVSLPQRKTRMYEIFGRVRANGGVYLPAARYMDFARREELVAALDNLTLLRCLQMLRSHREKNGTTPYVLNVSASTIRDKSFMTDLIAFLGTNHKMAQRLIFEIPQEELYNADDKTRVLLKALSKLGCRFSMDRVRSRRFDLELMKELQVRFIKLEAGWLLKEAKTQSGFNRINRLKKHLDAFGIDMIVEKIEGEDMLRELLDFNIDYGQGYLFGKPDHSAAFHKKAA